jgi:hypothetical protein
MTLPLFEEATDSEYGPSRGATFDAIGSAARAKLGVGPEWEWFTWEVVDRRNVESSPMIVEGAVPIGVTAKGNKKWPPDDDCQRTVIFDADIEAARVEYERTTGKCAECIEGHRFAGWHHVKGYKYKPCDRCGGTGKPRTLGEPVDDSGAKS